MPFFLQEGHTKAPGDRKYHCRGSSRLAAPSPFSVLYSLVFLIRFSALPHANPHFVFAENRTLLWTHIHVGVHPSQARAPKASLGQQQSTQPFQTLHSSCVCSLQHRWFFPLQALNTGLDITYLINSNNCIQIKAAKN